MTRDILRRILRDHRLEEAFEILAERLSPTDLQSLLLELSSRRASALKPGDVLARYREDRFVRPVDLDPRQLLGYEQLALSLLPDGFEVIDLSPLAPMGTVAALTPLDQKRVVTTIRNTEVVSDSTNVLALECALRRRWDHDDESAKVRTKDIKLCARHRLVRAQPTENPAFRPHFGVVSLCTAGRDTGGWTFEREALREHIDFFVRLLEATMAPDARGRLRVRVTTLGGIADAIVQRDVTEWLRRGHPGLDIALDPTREAGHGYYQALCFGVEAMDPNGTWWSLVDGGFTDWTRKLLSDAKERLLISAIGSELTVRVLQPDDGTPPQR